MTTSTRFPRIFFSTGEGSGSMGLPGLYGRNHDTHTFHQVEGDGGAGEGDAGEGEGGGEAEGEGGGEGGDDDAAVVKFASDKQKFMFPGMKKAMTVAEYQGSMLPKSQYEGAVNLMNELGKAIKARQKQGGQQQQQQQQRQQTPQRRASDTASDPLSQLEKMDLTDGKSVAAALRAIDGTRLQPLQQIIIGLAKKVQTLEFGLGTVHQDRSESAFSGDIDSVLATLKLPTIDGKPIEGLSELKEMVRDFYLSYDDADRKQLNAKLLAEQFGPRFEKTRKFFRALEKATLESARLRQRERIFARPGKGTSLNGKPRPMLSNRQAADALFDSSDTVS